MPNHQPHHALLSFKEWVADTLQTILHHHPNATLQQQIKQANVHFLESDLEQSTVPGTGLPEELVDKEEGMHQVVLFEGQKKGCLVMIMAITEVFLSCISLVLYTMLLTCLISTGVLDRVVGLWFATHFDRQERVPIWSSSNQAATRGRGKLGRSSS